MKIVFTNRATAENVAGDWSDWAVISITDPKTSFNQGLVEFSGKFKSELHLQFHDTDHGALMMGEGRVPAGPDDALKIVRFVEENKDCEGFLVHCKQGVSRSAAVAKYIALRLNLKFNAEYRDYHQDLFQMLIKASASNKK